MSGDLQSLSSYPDFSSQGSPRLPPRSPKIYASEIADPVPPPLPPRPPILDRTTTTHGDSSRDRLPQLSLVDNEVTEAELRQDYEDQEIERFLALFSAVTEVRASGGLSKPSQASGSRDAQGLDGIPQDEDESATSDTKTPRASKITSVDSKSLSEKIASEYVLPFLPPARPPPQPFSFGRLRVTAQRLYQTFDGDYLPLIFAMQRLAAWEEYNTSLNYCIAYWALWLFDLLPATFFTLILFTLLKRRLRPYPSLQELRARHAEMARADKFGIAVQNTLLKPSSFQAKDMWRLYRMLPSDKRKRSGKNGSLPDAPENVQPASEDSTPAVQIETPDGGSVPVLDEELDSVLTEQDLRTVGTQILSDIADFHERCHNLYLWKKPRSSLSVSAVLLFLALFFALLPARYVAKVIFFALGFVFWHVIPVIIALGPDGRVRLPPFLDAVPTDAEVALDMISQRVAQGLPVLPQRNSFFKLKSPGSASPSSPSPSRDNASAGSPYTDWTKWGERAATGKEWARGARRIVTRSNSERVEVGTADTTTGAKTYPAQHKRGPGLITITPTTIYFTLLSSSIPSLIIPLGDITSIRKGGILKGMSISWNRKDDNGLVVEEAEDVFRWIGGRDEVFARLLGSDGRKWLQA